jgi:hypothetical protein
MVTSISFSASLVTELISILKVDVTVPPSMQRQEMAISISSSASKKKMERRKRRR